MPIDKLQQISIKKGEGKGRIDARYRIEIRGRKSEVRRGLNHSTQNK